MTHRRKQLFTLVTTALSLACLLAAPARAQFSDVTAPEVVAFGFTPTSLDVSGGAQEITATFHLTDDLSGASSAYAYFRSPSGNQTLYLYAPLFSGDRLDGTFQGTLSFSPFAESGTWTVGQVYASDVVGNYALLDTTILAGRGFPTTLDITSSQSDTTPPQLTSVEFLPASVDVSGGDQIVEIRIGASDAEAGLGLSTCCNSFILIWSPSEQQYHYRYSYFWTLVSGDVYDGVWSTTINMPMFSEAGDWKVGYVTLQDAPGNWVTYFSATLDPLGLPTLPVISAPEDTTPPQITGFSFSPTVINTSTSSQLVTVTLDATDDLSGVVFSGPDSFGQASFRSPSGQQSQGICCNSFTLVSGTPLSGTWQGQIYFPQFSEEGTWIADYAQIFDRVTNYNYLLTAGLEAAGFPTQLVILRPSLETDGSIDTGGGTIPDDTFGSDAQVTFPPGAVAENTEVAIDVFLDPLDIPNPSGFIAAGTKFVNIQLTPEPSFPLPPPGLTITLPLENPLMTGTPLTLYKVDEATGDLVPEPSVYGGPVVGFVDGPGPDGTTATFTGVASLSTIVGLIPETITVSVDILPGSYPNPINTKTRGVVPVAILGSATFDVSLIKPETLTFGPGLAPPSHDLTDPDTLAYHTSDVNSDGFADLVFHPIQSGSGIAKDDTEACVGGEIVGGTPIAGCDAVSVLR